jgi:YD repeat-containing protein
MNITFSYNSGKTALDFGFGGGWTFTYNLLYEKSGAQITFQTGDGIEQTYTWNGSTWNPESGVFHELSEYQPGKFMVATKHGTKYFFDDSTHKKITKIEDRNLNALQFTYSGGKLSTITDACGKTLQFSWDGSGHLDQITDPNNGAPRIMKYKAELSQAGYYSEFAINPLDDTTRYQYGIWNNLINITDAMSKAVNIHFNPNKAVSNLECPETGSMKSFTYDTVTRITTVEEFVTSGNRITYYAYDLQGRVTSIQLPTGNHSYGYDSQNNVTSYTDPNGNVTSLAYDSMGNLLSATDALSNVVNYTYDAVYNQVLTFTDKNGNTYTNTYDTSGNLLANSDPYAEDLIRTYNSFGEMLTQTDKNSNTTEYTYDTFGNVISIKDPLNNIMSLTWTPSGNISGITNKNGNTTTYSFDPLNRLIISVNPQGNTVTLNYDKNSNLISRTNQNGNNTTYTYDALNRLIQKTEPDGSTTQWNYNEASNKTSITDPNGNITHFIYDCCRVTGITDPLGNSDLFSYDSNGNRLSHTNKTGQVTLFSYDVLNRQASFTDPLGNTTLFSYDPSGNLINQTDPLGNATSFTYDALNRLINTTNALGGTTGYTFDAMSNTISKTDENINVTTYAYDAMNRPVTVTGPMGGVAQASYDAVGNILTINDANGNPTTYGYDALYRPVSITNAIARQAGFIQNDGNIVGLDGSSNLRIQAGVDQNLYLVVWQRNNLGIMSAVPLMNSGNVYAYDFSIGSGQAYGDAAAHKEIAPGIWGMVNGDGNPDGLIAGSDKEVWISSAGTVGYIQADFNLDGEVDNRDKNDEWVPNIGKGSQVPN